MFTDQVVAAVSAELGSLQVGLCNVFCQHTSASLSINENARWEDRPTREGGESLRGRKAVCLILPPLPLSSREAFKGVR